MKKKVNLNTVKHNKIAIEWWKDAILFFDWCVENEDRCKRETQCSILDSFYIDRSDIDEGSRDIIVCNPRGCIRVWIYNNCPYSFVTDILMND